MLYNCLCTTGRYLDCNGTCLWNNVPLCSGKWKAKGLGSCGKWLSTYLVTLRNMMSLRGRSVHDTCGFCSTPRWSVLLTEIVHQKIPWNSVEILCQPTGFRFVTNILHTSNWSTKYMEVDNMAVSLTIYVGYFPLLSTAHQVWTKFRLFHNIVKTRLCSSRISLTQQPKWRSVFFSRTCLIQPNWR